MLRWYGNDSDRKASQDLPEVRRIRASAESSGRLIRRGEFVRLHRTCVSCVERGERNVTLETVEKFTAALKVMMVVDLMP